MKFKLVESNNFGKYHITSLPGNNGNAYSVSKRIFNNINITEDRIIESNRSLFEGIEWVTKDDEKGGVIIFSTDVNAQELSSNKIINYIKQKISTITNRLNSVKKIDKIARENNLIGWTVGKFLSGRYTSKKGKSFGENSLSVELVGVTTDTLIKISTELCDEFDQEEVMLKNYNDSKIYFISRD